MNRYVKFAAGVAVTGVVGLAGLTLVVQSKVDPEKLKAEIANEYLAKK